MSKSKGLPSLDQLAARINAQPPKESSNDSSARIRLPLTSLRTGSTTSINTTASSSADSTAVQPPATRSTSPSAITITNSGASTPSSEIVVPTGGDPNLTADKLEKLQQLSADSPNSASNSATPSPIVPSATAPKKQVKGYKNIPSLDAITARLLKPKIPPQELSIDGTDEPPELPTIEDPKTPGLQMKAPEHPLQHPWTIFHDTKAKYPFTPAPGPAPVSVQSPASATPDGHFIPAPVDSNDYEAGLTVIGTFHTVEQFCRYFNWLKPPSKLEKNSNYHLFKEGIKPMWEDPANKDGGKWVLTMKNNPALLDRCWSWVAMALVGEELEEDMDEICGAVVWTRTKEDVEKINGIGRKLVKLLDVGEKDGIGLEFQYNTDDRPQPNKFLSIQSMPPTGSFRSSFNHSSPVQGAGGFGSGVGLGGGVPLGHSHSRSVGGANGNVGHAEQQGPQSAHPSTGFSGGALGGWRK
ncbi:hypothetical protein PQX77_007586 [Marasmius sp. AFHP31]|nr:hypothetical protein PQX77_007586 [Marasmius sp. AFHP31]